jgi:hypothetical protein
MLRQGDPRIAESRLTSEAAIRSNRPYNPMRIKKSGSQGG